MRNSNYRSFGFLAFLTKYIDNYQEVSLFSEEEKENYIESIGIYLKEKEEIKLKELINQFEMINNEAVTSIAKYFIEGLSTLNINASNINQYIDDINKITIFDNTQISKIQDFLCNFYRLYINIKVESDY